MDVRSIMTPDPVTVPGEMRCDTALELMDDQDVRHLPVVDDGELVGILSDRDLLASVGWPPHGPRPSKSNGLPGLVRSVMHREVQTVSPDDSIVMATLQMTLSHIGCLPVLEDGQLCGILTEMDVAAAFWRSVRHRMPDVDPPVADVMTADPVSCPSETTLADAAALCHEHGFRHLPVVDGELLVGVLSERDLSTAFGNRTDWGSPVAAIMSREPITIDPQQVVSEAAETLIVHKISSLPVVQDERLIGILTLTDVLEHCMNALHEPESAEG
ncbi:MAG: CBS domain-containing protein [Planctomycetes bacterium]|nr:CBS domain-containing protein [Planctomycetota bacterium]